MTESALLVRRLHLAVGTVGMLLFLLSGQYFQHALHGLQDLEDVPRLLLRSSHVYFFFACFVNVLFGLYFSMPSVARRYALVNQPLLIGYGFLFESMGQHGIDRPVASLGVVALFVWLCNRMVIAALAAWQRRAAR